jgi:hypothetical protein
MKIFEDYYHILNKSSPLHIHKVKAHQYILRNEVVNKLAKERTEKATTSIIESYHNAHTSPYWLLSNPH